MWALRVNNNLEAGRLLIDARANIEAIDDPGNHITVLAQCVVVGHLDAVRLLLEEGASTTSMAVRTHASHEN